MNQGRAVVIGAGAAGLTAAVTLQREGRITTVLEKELVVGGKCRSLVWNGVPYDVGANLTTPRYTTVRPLAERLGLELRELPGRRIVSLDGSEPPAAPSGWLGDLVLELGESLYAAARSRSGADTPGYVSLDDDAFEPFGEWLERRLLGRFAPMFANLFVAYGYGDMMRLPAAYALKFFDPIHMEIAIDVVQRKPVSASKTFAEGYQALWERLVRAEGIDVRCGARVASVRRGPDEVEVTWGSSDGTTTTERFDQLVLACPLDAALGFLDASDEERRLFSMLRYNDYYVTGAVLEGAVETSTFLHPYGSRVDPGKPTIFYPPVPGHPDHVYFFYAYGGEGVTEQTVRAEIERLMARDDVEGELVQMLDTVHWRYFPHVTSTEARAGFYRDLDALQGKWRTIYVGEVVSFTLVELIAVHTEALVRTHLTPLG